MPRGYPESPRALGEHIRKRRVDLGLLQREVAVRIGVDITTVTNWELGHTQPAIRHLPGIARFLGGLPGMAPASLGDRLRAARRMAGLSQAALAARLGVNVSSVAGWEQGEHQPTGRCRKLLEELLGRDARSRPGSPRRG